ncbi:hypothetical protein [Blastomonas sp. AAP53]|uniref:hypothetical protein n=1 Tax=Blastomonas sp. AAP53 TaxID=1248760 RepID=UPI00126736F5|nr:hypothetical protein [Blastomonas sp. AAP53]
MFSIKNELDTDSKIHVPDGGKLIEINENEFQIYTDCEWKYRNWFAKWNYFEQLEIESKIVWSCLEYLVIKIRSSEKCPPIAIMDDLHKFPELTVLLGIASEGDLYLQSVFKFANGNMESHLCLQGDANKIKLDDDHYYLLKEDEDGVQTLVRKSPITYIDTLVEEVKSDRVLEGALMLLGYKLCDDVIQ